MENETPTVPVQGSNSVPRSSPNPRTLYLLIAVLLVALLGVGAYLLLSNRSPDTSNQDTTTDETTDTELSESDDLDSETDEDKMEDGTDTGEEDSDEEAATTVQIYFYKEPLEDTIPGDPVAVDRETDDENLISYIIGQLIAGPTAEEQAEGYVSAFSLTGDSNCGGNSYEYTLSGGVLQVTFCKTIEPYFPYEDAWAGITIMVQHRALQSMTESLMIDGVDVVQIYDMNDHCWGIESGANGCTEWEKADN